MARLSALDLHGTRRAAARGAAGRQPYLQPWEQWEYHGNIVGNGDFTLKNGDINGNGDIMGISWDFK